jgi:tetratricopeptide (TPR) repeat protein
VREALLLTQVLVDQPAPSHSALAAHAAALKLLGRREEALPFDEQAIARFPQSGVAWHNYAATLGDLGRGAASKAACEKAFASVWTRRRHGASWPAPSWPSASTTPPRPPIARA